MMEIEKQTEEDYSDAFAEFAESEDKKDSPPVEQPAPVEEAPVDWEAKAKEFEHKFQSDAGRVGAMQRKINELEAEKQSRSFELPPLQAASDDPPDEQLADFKEEYPDIYQGVEKYMETELQRRTDSLRAEIQQQLQPVDQMMYQQQTANELAVLSNEHPDWQQLAQDQNFANWVGQQPQQVQQMAGSDYASDVTFVLNAYKSTQQPRTQSQSTVQGIAQKRERQLQSGVSVNSRGVASSSATPAEDDYHSSFEFYANKQ